MPSYKDGVSTHFCDDKIQSMNQIFTVRRSTKVSILGLSLVLLTYLPQTRGAAAAVSLSPQQSQITTKTIISPDRLLAKSYSRIPSPSLTKVANLSPPKTLNTQGTATGRSIKITEISGTVTFKGRSAQIGDRLLAPGDEIITGPNSTARLAIDNNIGIIELAEQTAVRISSLSGASGEEDTAIFVSRGRVRLSVGKTIETTETPNTSTIIQPNQIAALNTSSGIGKSSQLVQKTRPRRTARVRVETPQGVAGVRGTSFGVSVGPDGKTGVDTIEGSVGVSGNADSEVIVNRGNATTVFPQTPPVAPARSPAVAKLTIYSLLRLTDNTYRFSGEIDPMDILYINNEAITIDRQGKFQIQRIVPSSRRLKIVVRGPSVRERHYEIAVP